MCSLYLRANLRCCESLVVCGLAVLWLVNVFPLGFVKSRGYSGHVLLAVLVYTRVLVVFCFSCGCSWDFRVDITKQGSMGKRKNKYQVIYSPLSLLETPTGGEVYIRTVMPSKTK